MLGLHWGHIWVILGQYLGLGLGVIIGIMEEKMETTILYLYRDHIGNIQGLYRGSIGT